MCCACAQTRKACADISNVGRLDLLHRVHEQHRCAPCHVHTTRKAPTRTTLALQPRCARPLVHRAAAGTATKHCCCHPMARHCFLALRSLPPTQDHYLAVQVRPLEHSAVAVDHGQRNGVDPDAPVTLHACVEQCCLQVALGARCQLLCQTQLLQAGVEGVNIGVRGIETRVTCQRSPVYMPQSALPPAC